MKIGENCLIHPNVTIVSDAVIGDNVIIGSGTVIGGDAFYYKKRPEGYDPLISCGGVCIENDVHIGTGCTIDRGVTADTTIGCLLYTSPSPRDRTRSRMPSSA